MKKLMVVLGAIALACSANASQYIWGLASMEYYDHDEAELTTGKAFLYLGNVTASESAFNLSGCTYITQAGFDDTNYGYGDLSTKAMPSSDAILAEGGQAYSIILTESAVSSLDGYEGYYTIVKGTSTAGTLPGTTPVNYGDLSDATTVVTTSSYMAAPEPTSGLLLLLGMAGLALKRRRA